MTAEQPSEQTDIAFCCLYWSFLRGETVFEPLPEHHGLDRASGEVLKAQCLQHFKNHK